MANEELLLQVWHLRQHLLEAHVEELLFKLLHDQYARLEDCLPAVLQKMKWNVKVSILGRVSTYDYEVVPDAQQFPHILAGGLVLHRLREERDEVGRAEVAAVHTLFLQVSVQVGQQYRYESVESIEVKLQHWKLCVEQSAQLEDLDYLAHDSKSKGFITEEKVKKASDKVHSLAVVKLRVDNSVSEQYFAQIFILDPPSVPKGPLDVLFYFILNLLG